VGVSSVQLRLARPDEQAWLNDRYTEIGFQLSDLTRDLQIIAELDGQRAGTGRLVPVGENAVELGGMLVLDEYRGQGVARAIIDELLRQAGARDVYCIPFADIEGIYTAAGFVRCEDGPEAVVGKVAWCATKYSRKVVLLRKAKC
jgi:GNAT superfamily N-acetyltransferase